MPTTKPTVISAIHKLVNSSSTLLDQNLGGRQRETAAMSYLEAFCRAAEDPEQNFLKLIPFYATNLNEFLSLAEHHQEPDGLKHNTLNMARCTLRQLDAAAECEAVLNNIKYMISPHLMDSFQAASTIKGSVISHIDLQLLMERLLVIAETPTQSSTVRQEAIITFHEVSNSAVTTFGQSIRRTDYDPRFQQIASSTNDRDLIAAAMEVGYTWRAPDIS